MALKLPLLNVSSADLGITVPGLTKDEWTDVKESSNSEKAVLGKYIRQELMIKSWLKSLEGKQKQKERDLFAKEVRILSGLRCKHVVGVEGYCSNPDAVILEYVYFDFKTPWN